MNDDEPVLDISSLIDVCFLLLIYFLVTSTIQPREQDLPMSIPGFPGAPPESSINVLISVKENGTIAMNTGENEELLDSDKSIREIPHTKERLGLIRDLARANGSEVFVQIYTEEGVTHQRFIDVLNCLSGEGISKIAIARLDQKPL